MKKSKVMNRSRMLKFKPKQRFAVGTCGDKGSATMSAHRLSSSMPFRYM